MRRHLTRVLGQDLARPSTRNTTSRHPCGCPAIDTNSGVMVEGRSRLRQSCSVKMRFDPCEIRRPLRAACHSPNFLRSSASAGLVRTRTGLLPRPRRTGHRPEATGVGSRRVQRNPPTRQRISHPLPPAKSRPNFLSARGRSQPAGRHARLSAGSWSIRTWTPTAPTS